jgi:hypothetical protein
MVVERYKRGPKPVYERFHARGRMAPDGVTYVSSWIDERLDRCFQVMETSDRRLLDEWMSHWSDIVDFEVVPVLSSAEAAERSLGSASGNLSLPPE